MIIYHRIAASELLKYRRQMLRFIRDNGDNHITKKAYTSFRLLAPQALEQEGNIVFIGLQGRTLAGLIFCEHYGQKTSFAVVGKKYRSRGVGKALLQQAMAGMKKFYAEVAVDNVPSMKLLFSMGMVAYDVFPRYGKMILKVKNEAGHN